MKKKEKNRDRKERKAERKAKKKKKREQGEEKAQGRGRGGFRQKGRRGKTTTRRQSDTAMRHVSTTKRGTKRAMVRKNGQKKRDCDDAQPRNIYI